MLGISAAKLAEIKEGDGGDDKLAATVKGAQYSEWVLTIASRTQVRRVRMCGEEASGKCGDSEGGRRSNKGAQSIRGFDAGKSQIVHALSHARALSGVAVELNSERLVARRCAPAGVQR